MRDIKYLVMDVDGTLTDGKIYMGAQGEVCKAIINCDLILDDLERLERDVKKYDVSDAVVKRLREGLESKKKRIKKNWSKAKENKYIQKCKKEYIVEVNS